METKFADHNVYLVKPAKPLSRDNRETRALTGILVFVFKNRILKASDQRLQPGDK